MPEDKRGVVVDLPRVGILLLKYKNPELESKAVASLLFRTVWPFRLEILDNRGGTKNMAKIWNKWIMDSSEDYLAIIDSDIYIETQGWLSRMMGYLQGHPDIGAVVPRTDNCGEVRQNDIKPGESPEILAHASGFFFLFKKKVLGEVGFFDEDFVFYGQDSEWFARMHYTTQFKTALLPEVFVRHQAHASTQDDPDYDFSADKRKALALYHQKVASYSTRVI